MDRDDSQDADVEVFVLPSRQAALDACREALEAEAGPVLVTGEPGAGKTWLARRLAAGWTGPAGWIAVDLTPTTGPDELLRAIVHALGLIDDGPGGMPRLALADALAEMHADGRRWALIVDEVHLASAHVLEEVRVLSNRLGRPDGFAALVLLGQTPLARRVGTRPLAALEARLAARVHLRPIDADEARSFLAHLRADRADALALVEHWHRIAGGNPRRLLRLAATAPSWPVPARPARRAPAAPIEAPVEVPAFAPTANPPRLGPAKPPIRVEDGLIEVGWEADAEPDSAQRAVEEPSTSLEPAPALVAEESIDDHYAALQAWNEWAANQGRRPADPPDLAAGPRADTASAEPDLPADLAGHPQVWAEGQQSFAPYSQLFSRMRQPRDPD